MAGRQERFLEMPTTSPGTLRLLKVLSWGAPDARPKAYLQAALHADELPGMLVAHRLAALLDEADAAGEVVGQVVLVPVANPVGLAQRMQGNILGRLAFDSGQNFNRGHGDLAGAAAALLDGRLGDDAAANGVLLREALRRAAAAMPGDDEGAWLRRTLLEMAVDADVCLDLHCDNEAVLHLYTHTAGWPRAAGLAARLDARGVFLADISGGHPFDEAVSRPHAELAERFPGHPLPAPPLSATVELRGLADVNEALADADARGLLAFLRDEGIVAGDAGPLPEPCQATPLAGVEHLRSPVAGLVAHRVAVGERVTRGQCVARIIDPMASFGDGVTELTAGTDGLVYARTHHRMAAPGTVIAGIAGSDALPGKDRGPLLTD